MPGIDFHLARIELDEGRPEAATELLDRMEPLFDQPLLRPRLGALRVLQADAALQRGDPRAATRFAEDGIARLADHPDDDLTWKLHRREGRALTAMGMRAPALATFLQGASAADQLRKSPLGYR